MTNKKIPVRTYMTEAPWSIGCDQTLSVAHDLMRAHRIRHLPVLHGGKLVGMLSQRDLHLVESLPDVDPAVVRVDEAMTSDPYTVQADDDIGEVAAYMAKHRLGSAVVVEEQRVTGVLTTVDALRALAETLSD